MQVIIDNKPYEVQEGMTIEQACMQAGIRIPTLCNLKDVSSNASCGICVVEVKGAKSLLRSCITKVTDGMEITTNNARILRARKMNVELLLANHPLDCQTCERNQRCELQQITYEFGIDQRRLPRTRPKQLERDYSSLSLIRDPEKCILCGRCVAVCKEVQTVSAIDFAGRGQKSKISTFMDMGLGMVDCTNCGQCALVCPTGAIIEKSHVSQIWEAIHDPKKVVVVQTAPAIRVGIGEEMGMPMGSLNRKNGSRIASFRLLQSI